jgi:hypothetical protein
LATVAVRRLNPVVRPSLAWLQVHVEKLRG